MKPTRVLIVILIIAVIGTGAYVAWKNYSKQNDKIEVSNNKQSVVDEEAVKRTNRDNRRIADLNIIGRALVDYARDNNNQYPKTNGTEKISNENSLSFKTLKDGGYLGQLYQDPIPDKYYYGYKSDGLRFDLTAVLEDKSDSRCSIKGNFCIYKFTSEEAAMILNTLLDGGGFYHDYNEEFFEELEEPEEIE